MDSRIQIFNSLTSVDGQDLSIQQVLNFADSLNWKPSYYFEPSFESFSNGHVVVEHGLSNTAILTFLKRPFSELNFDEVRSLLNLSYNNLIEWNVPISRSHVNYIYNRNIDKKEVRQFEIQDGLKNEEVLTSDNFEKVVLDKPYPNVKFLDDILIETIQFWQINLKSKKADLTQEDLSNFFNTLILLRAIEDHQKRKLNLNKNNLLIDFFNNTSGEITLTELIEKAFSHLSVSIDDSKLVDKRKLANLDTIDIGFFKPIFREFYFNKYKDYFYYDFSIISKHALSRIYEKYVTILRIEDETTSLFGEKQYRVKAETNKHPGLAYTPEYLARFFAKYIVKNYPQINIQPVKILEPAIGSGIFLRSILEAVGEKFYDKLTVEYFDNILGNDLDKNAVNAAKLSIALLYLSELDKLPYDLNIINKEAIEYLGISTDYHNKFDIIVSNPPFIRPEEQNTNIKEKLNEYLGDLKKGRADTYLAFLKMGIDLLKEKGLGLFILPSSFLISDAAERMRKKLKANCTIKLVCDLSAIQVFENKSVYVIIIIFEKGLSQDYIKPKIMKAKAKVGDALESALLGLENINANFQVFDVDESVFESKRWYLLNKMDMEVKQKIEKHPLLREFLEIRQGVVTGRDNIFIIDKAMIPTKEEKIYKPYIPDKNISSFEFNKRTNKYIIYPIINGVDLNENELKSNFPKTHKYLLKYKKDNTKWWLPHRSRKEYIFNPKIITPHLSIIPKFALDETGEYVVSRSPFMFLKNNQLDDLLYYFLGVLNSSICYWYLNMLAHKFSQSYNTIEVRELEEVPVPSPSLNNKMTIEIVKLTKRIMGAKGLDRMKDIAKLEKSVANLYGIDLS